MQNFTAIFARISSLKWAISCDARISETPNFRISVAYLFKTALIAVFEPLFWLTRSFASSTMTKSRNFARSSSVPRGISPVAWRV